MAIQLKTPVEIIDPRVLRVVGLDESGQNEYGYVELPELEVYADYAPTKKTFMDYVTPDWMMYDHPASDNAYNVLARERVAELNSVDSKTLANAGVKTIGILGASTALPFVAPYVLPLSATEAALTAASFLPLSALSSNHDIAWYRAYHQGDTEDVLKNRKAEIENLMANYNKRYNGNSWVLIDLTKSEGSDAYRWIPTGLGAMWDTGRYMVSKINSGKPFLKKLAEYAIKLGKSPVGGTVIGGLGTAATYGYDWLTSDDEPTKLQKEHEAILLLLLSIKEKRTKDGVEVPDRTGGNAEEVVSEPDNVNTLPPTQGNVNIDSILLEHSKH